MANHPTTNIFIDKYHPKADGKCAISIRVTFNRKKRYYPTKYKLTVAEFDKLFTERPREPYKTILQVLSHEEVRARDIIDSFKTPFTFSAFEKKFSRKPADAYNLFALIEDRSRALRQDGRISTAVTYECALHSLKKFYKRDQLLLEDVSVEFLNKYKNWMIEGGNSLTTIGIYLRNVRAIFNEAISEDAALKDIYPFGAKRGRFNIPTGRNIKKSLRLVDIAAVYNYHPKNENEAKAKDFWLLSYLGNGMNVKDIALLKNSNIDGQTIKFERAKTQKRNEAKPVIISFPITDDIKRIISRWGAVSLDKNAYVFPILNERLNSEEVYNKIQLFTRFINDYMKQIAANLNINANITTYVARHSFSTVLQRSGANIAAISEALGHGSLKTTQNYLAGFEDEDKIKMVKELTNFEKLMAV